VVSNDTLDEGPWATGVGEIWWSNPSQNIQSQIAAATWRIETRSDFAFYQITLVFVVIISDSEEVREA